MSKQETKRANMNEKDFDALTKDSSRVVSDLAKQTSIIKVLIVFLHDNLLNNRGDLSEGDRVDIRSAMTPLYPQLTSSVDELTALFGIYNEDLATWQANFDAYLVANPDTLQKAIDRFPKVD